MSLSSSLTFTSDWQESGDRLPVFLNWEDSVAHSFLSQNVPGCSELQLTTMVICSIKHHAQVFTSFPSQSHFPLPPLLGITSSQILWLESLSQCLLLGALGLKSLAWSTNSFGRSHILMNLARRYEQCCGRVGGMYGSTETFGKILGKGYIWTRLLRIVRVFVRELW